MRNEIEQLREHQHQNERLLAALISKERPEEMLEKLRKGQSIEAVLGELEIMDEDKGVGKQSTRNTTYPHINSVQAIDAAMHSARSVGNLPSSAIASTDSRGRYTPQQHGDPGQWDQQLAWGSEDESGPSHRQEDTEMHDDGAMPWSGELGDEGQWKGPVVGKWHIQSGDNFDNTTTTTLRTLGRQTILGDTFASGEQAIPDLEPWTAVTSDEALIEHLTALYFCWEYPTFAPLSKEHFLEDFRQGKRRHCSSLLVNAMLAVGCRFSTQAVTRTDPNDSNTSGDHFFKEASRLLLEQEDRHAWTTVQALGLMSVREASSGRSSEAIYYSGQSIRLAIEMGLHMEDKSLDDSSELMVRSATFWGAFTLDQ